MFQDVTSELEDILVGIMLDQEHRVASPFLLEGCVDQLLLTVQVVFCVPIMAVNFLVGNMISEITHILHASSLGGALDVGRSHVGGVLADDVDQSSFNLEHFYPSLFGTEVVHVRMRPGVRPNLVAVSVHTFDRSNPGVVLVDLALAHVVRSNEEGGSGIVTGQDVEQPHSVV
jgi:hypothetical protein